MDRKSFIGGSDIAAVMGVSRWKTPLQLWAEKTGQIEPEDLSNNEAVEMGSELEETVARIFTKRTGKKVRRAPKNYTYQVKQNGGQIKIDAEFSFIRCQVDRLVEGTDELLECKTASAWKEKEWEGEEIPTEYILQVNWQLGITGRSIGHIAVLIGGQKFLYKEIQFDRGLFNDQINAAVNFWNMVKAGTPPVAEAADNSFMVELHPNAGAAMKEATADVIAAVSLLQQTKAQIIDLEKIKKEIEAKLKASIGDNLGIDTPEYVIKWIPVKGSTFTVTKKDSRMLRITKKKG